MNKRYPEEKLTDHFLPGERRWITAGNKGKNGDNTLTIIIAITPQTMSKRKSMMHLSVATCKTSAI